MDYVSWISSFYFRRPIDWNYIRSHRWTKKEVAMKKIVCIECNGRGFIIVVDQQEPCPMCEGKGTVRRVDIVVDEDEINDTPF